MTPPDTFIKQVDIVLKNRIGAAIAGSILKNNISKLNTNVSSLTKQECQVFIEHIVNAITLFVSYDESKQVKIELDKILTTSAATWS